MTQIEETTEARFFAEYDRTKDELAHARQEIALLTEQLRTANLENEKLSYKCDFLLKQVKQITDSRDQYERIAIRLVGKMDGALDAWTAMAEKMKEEIREAAFTKAPMVAPEPEKKPRPETDEAIEEVAKMIGTIHNLPKPAYG
jgi:chromosome segregation ATPase